MNSRIYRWSLRVSWVLLLIVLFFWLNSFTLPASHPHMNDWQVLMRAGEVNVWMGDRFPLQESPQPNPFVVRQFSSESLIFDYLSAVYANGTDFRKITIHPWVFWILFGTLPVVQIVQRFRQPSPSRSAKVRPARLLSKRSLVVAFLPLALMIPLSIATYCVDQMIPWNVGGHFLPIGSSHGQLLIFTGGYPFYNGIRDYPSGINFTVHTGIAFAVRFRYTQLNNGSSDWTAGLNVYALLALCTIPPALIVYWRIRQKFLGICPKCNYDLRGNPAAVACPECGTARPPTPGAAP